MLGSDWTPAKLIAMQPLKKKKSFFNCKINVRTGFLDPKNMGKDTKIEFLPQILSYGVLNILLIWLRRPFFIFCSYDRKVAKGCWSGTFPIFVHMICQVNDVKYDM